MRIPGAEEARSTDPLKAATCAASARRPAGRRVRPRAGVPCQNTTAARARPTKNSPGEGQKKDGVLPRARMLPQGRILQTCLTKKGQLGPHRPCDERFQWGAEHAST